MKTKAKFLLAAMFWLTALFSMTPFLGLWLWLADLTAHFREYYFWFQLLFAAVFLRAKKKKLFLAALCFCAINGVFVWKANWEFANITSTPEEWQRYRMKILSFNMLKENRRFDEIKNLIEGQSPDIIGFYEYSHETQNALADTLNHGPSDWKFPGRIILASPFSADCHGNTRTFLN